MTTTASYSLLCLCGARVVFDESMRGRVTPCACGRLYRIPRRVDAIGRALGRVRWAIRWLLAGDHRARRSDATAPYREGVPRVACPRCDVAPSGDPVWQCEFCLCVWNTFDTRGRCPGCGFTFPATFCPACRETSRHRDWYRPAALLR